MGLLGVVMTQQAWNKLSFFEQMSNIDGDVQRLIRAHEKYIRGESPKDNGEFYLENIKKLVKMILLDDKCADKGYRAVELYDEIEQLRDYLQGKCSEEYINSYWSAYTNAIS